MGIWQQMQRAAEKGKRDALANYKVPRDAPPICHQPSKVIKRGPKPSGKAKKLISLRLDPEVIDGFKCSGEGWQARMNAVLRKHLGL